MYENLATLAIFAFAFSVIAGRIERSTISGPIIFILFGLVAGPLGFGLLALEVNAVELRVVADLTLALVLFIDASNADLSVLRLHSVIPKRMLTIALPLCIAMGIGLGMLVFPDVALFELCILATMLAATDAALGKGVVSNKEVPPRVRESLNAESGLNDGLCVPVLFVFLALATGTAGEAGGVELALKLVLKELGIGIAVAVIIVTLGSKVVRFCYSRGWFTDVWIQIPVVTLALACFATAQSLHGSGYIAAFVGGLLFGHFSDKDTHKLVLAGEGLAELLAMLTWVIFGSVYMGYYWSSMTADVVIYSLLSLTVIRMLPVIIALIGTGEKFETKMFLAWFGPRGLASIVFLVIVSASSLPAESVLAHTVVCTITLCIVAHGLTANVWAKRLARKLKVS
ncbi:MAG: cation:proton antiporter [Porticoccus sp.]|nr:cation:proton antiporter [Porticoccus sp.]